MSETFHGPLATHLEAFLEEKRACGYTYIGETKRLREFDRFLAKHGCPHEALPRELVELWGIKQPHQRPRTHRSRVSIISQFARYLCRVGLSAYVPDPKLGPIARIDFVPYIFTRQEVRRLLEAADRLAQNARSPERHLVIPEVFRVLYGCGLRVGEALRLRVEDVDLVHGVLTIRQGKFRKDRLVPMATSLVTRLCRYAQVMGLFTPGMAFFPKCCGSAYRRDGIYPIFRQLLRESGISYGGRGKGPRMHDLRHTFAVHCLERWYRQGEDLNARLPLLVAYLGHKTLLGTQRYLRLTPTVFPDITARLETFFHSSLSGGASHVTH